MNKSLFFIALVSLSILSFPFTAFAYPVYPCIVEDSGVCRKCAPGYTLSIGNGAQDGKCKPCSEGCLNCEDDLYRCTECNSSGWTLDNASGKCVSKCPTGCLYCTDGGRTCTMCNSKYYKSSGRCYPCPEGCEFCDPPDMSGCTTSSCAAEAQPFCTICSSGFNYVNGKCVTYNCNNLPHCMDCTADGVCTKCDPGYSLSSSGCVSCLSDGCLDCSDSYNVCKQCYSNWELYNGKCLSNCPSGCLSCSDSAPRTCYVCLSGYVMDENGKCSSCPTHCEKCTSTKQCTQCQTGYTLKDGYCLANWVNGSCPSGLSKSEAGNCCLK